MFVRLFSYSHPDRLAGIHCSQSTHSSEELRENLWEGDQEEGTDGVRSQRVTEQSRGDAQDPVGAGSVSPCDSICTRKATRMRYSVTLVISGCRFCLACEDLVCVALLPCGEVGNLFTRHMEESFVQVAPAPDQTLRFKAQHDGRRRTGRAGKRGGDKHLPEGPSSASWLASPVLET